MVNYLKDIDGIYIPLNGRTPFNYSDGDLVEAQLERIFKSTSNLSNGSEELSQHVTNWPTLYHLSPKRPLLLYPYEDKIKGKRILEIGCGAGAITSYLSDLAVEVYAIEGSYRRCRLTSQRCEGKGNLKVICDNFLQFNEHQKFDVITLIGVLEYANLYSLSSDPVIELLNKVNDYLTADGIVILAIENKYGLKYWTGAPEDHIGQQFAGIEGQYSRSTPVTFGLLELEQKIKNAGMEISQDFYPFPDYKLPDVIIKGGKIPDGFNVADLLMEKTEYHGPIAYTPTFSVSSTLDGIIKNGLFEKLSNSFLLTLSVTKAEKETKEDNILAYAFSSTRKPAFCKVALFEHQADGNILVKRQKLYPHVTQEPSLLQQSIENESYIRGKTIFTKLIEILNSNDWTRIQLSSWADSYYAIIEKLAIPVSEGPVISGEFFDLCPFNIILDDNGEAHFFDLEWKVNDAIPLAFLYFRGILNSLFRVSTITQPRDNTTLEIFPLTKVLTLQKFQLSDIEFDKLLDKEFELLRMVSLGKFGDIRTRYLATRSTTTTGGQTESLWMNSNLKLMSQIYWKRTNAEFNEAESILDIFQFDGQKHDMYFNNIPTENIETLRIDPSRAIAIFYIELIECRDSNGLVFLSSDENDFLDRVTTNNCLLMRSACHYPSLLCVCMNDDPSIEFLVADLHFNGPQLDVLVRYSRISQTDIENERRLSPVIMHSTQ